MIKDDKYYDGLSDGLIKLMEGKEADYMIVLTHLYPLMMAEDAVRRKVPEDIFFARVFKVYSIAFDQMTKSYKKHEEI